MAALELTVSKFKPAGSVSVTKRRNICVEQNILSSYQGRHNSEPGRQCQLAGWDLDLGGNKLTLGSTVSSFTVQKALNIANGESLLSSGSSVINLSDTLTVAKRRKLTSGTGNVQISGALTLNGEMSRAEVP